MRRSKCLQHTHTPVPALKCCRNDVRVRHENSTEARIVKLARHVYCFLATHAENSAHSRAKRGGWRTREPSLHATILGHFHVFEAACLRIIEYTLHLFREGRRAVGAAQRLLECHDGFLAPRIGPRHA